MPKDLSVLIISSEYPPFLLGGLGTHVYELTKGLQRRGVNVYVFAHNPGRDEIISDGSITVCYFSLPGVNPSQGPAERELDFDDVRHLNRVVAEKAKSLFSERTETIDIIHSHDWFGFEAGCELRRAFGAPLISTVHMLYNPFVTWWGSPLSPALVKAESDMCTQSDLVITVSHAMKQAIVGAYGASPKSVKVIYNGFDPQPPGDDVVESTAALRERVAASGEKIVLYAGRLTPMKGLEQLLLSASRVVKEFENVVYLICGRHLDDSYAWELIKLVEGDSNLRKRVKLLGWQSREQLQALYSIADIAVVPSRFEPFGYAALEAMAAQVPVVATDVGGLSEVLAGNVGGLLAPLVAEPRGRRHADVEKLAEAQLTLLQNPSLAREIAMSGSERAHTEFGFDKMIDATLEAYWQEARAPEARGSSANS